MEYNVLYVQGRKETAWHIARPSFWMDQGPQSWPPEWHNLPIPMMCGRPIIREGHNTLDSLAWFANSIPDHRDIARKCLEELDLYLCLDCIYALGKRLRGTNR